MSNNVDNRIEKRREKKKIIYAISLVTQIGISMMVPIFLCVAIAVVISDRTGKDWVVPVAILLGVVTSFRNVYILTKKMYAKDFERENEELLYFEEMKKERESKLEDKELKQKTNK